MSKQVLLELGPFFEVPQGRYTLGSSLKQIYQALDVWKDRLLDNYSFDKFKDWLMKEYPMYSVELKKFSLSATLISNKLFICYLKENDDLIPESIRNSELETHPVWGVSFHQARNFCDWLSSLDPRYSYRLPSECEWEACARGMDGRQYPYGEEFNPCKSNTIESNIGKTTNIYAYEKFPGPFGHLDLAGNVEEWVSDTYWVYPGGKCIKDDLFEKYKYKYNILRGGSFCRGGDLSRGARRHGPFPDPRFRFTGFRVIKYQKESI